MHLPDGGCVVRVAPLCPFCDGVEAGDHLQKCPLHGSLIDHDSYGYANIGTFQRKQPTGEHERTIPRCYLDPSGFSNIAWHLLRGQNHASRCIWRTAQAGMHSLSQPPRFTGQLATTFPDPGKNQIASIYIPLTNLRA
jgi:hypothetical protein